ncbi:DgyrCDS10598 [Dimorphilus gyrociliatus]|uniref:DgyrCDS10598 n=1 Tax=Dimorphilus gyrociliatus TaxID=2664684 RepID=A0A7I8W0Q1_9ANNE|nr:DgyrCDS10598 [Dimorphilus gyrociliatus]
MKKDPKKTELVKKFVAYWIMKHYKLYPTRKVVCLMDMTNTGISNMVDLDLIKFIVTCFIQYFPAYLAYLLIFDMPWLFNAIWQVIRKILSEEERKFVIFVTKSNIKNYIDEDHLFSHMGGNDTFEYKYERPLQTPKREMSFSSVKDSSTQESSSFKKFLTSKESLNSPLIENGGVLKPKRLFSGDIATITPSTDLVFEQTSKSYTRQSIEIIAHSKPIAFKVKTTNPSAFKVKPSSGITSSQFQIEIFACDGITKNIIETSRFLVMIQSIDEDITSVNQVTHWRDNDKYK